jgi:hypothetical protein
MENPRFEKCKNVRVFAICLCALLALVACLANTIQTFRLLGGYYQKGGCGSSNDCIVIDGVSYGYNNDNATCYIIIVLSLLPIGLYILTELLYCGLQPPRVIYGQEALLLRGKI